MTIWKLTCNEIEKAGMIIPSSFIAARNKKWEKYYSNEEKAKEVQHKKYEAMQELVGITSNYEFILEEIEVME